MIGPAVEAILVGEQDADDRAELDRAVDEGVLAVGGFAIGAYLMHRGLTDVDDGQAIEMPGPDVGESEATAGSGLLPGASEGTLMGVMAGHPTIVRPQASGG